jgi:hypothetical protein
MRRKHPQVLGSEREARVTEDVAVMRKSMREVDDGRGKDAGTFFDELRGRLLEMKAATKDGTSSH